MRCGAERPEELRNELGQDLSRSLAAGRPQPAVMPATHQCGNRSRPGKAEPRKRAERFRIVLDSGEDEIARTGETGRLLEQFGIVPLDRAEVAKQIADKGICPRIAEKDPDPRYSGVVRWQDVRLRVIDHLQAVLEAAQEPIIVDQISRRRVVDAAGGGKAA